MLKGKAVLKMPKVHFSYLADCLVSRSTSTSSLRRGADTGRGNINCASPYTTDAKLDTARWTRPRPAPSGLPAPDGGPSMPVPASLAGADETFAWAAWSEARMSCMLWLWPRLLVEPEVDSRGEPEGLGGGGFVGVAWEWWAGEGATPAWDSLRMRSKAAWTLHAKIGTHAYSWWYHPQRGMQALWCRLMLSSCTCAVHMHLMC